MSTFDYSSLIDRLSTEGFRLCALMLYSVLDYQYMEEKDVRRIDLCERAYMLTKYHPMTPAFRPDKTVEGYVRALKYYFENFLKCKRGSIADQYRSRALQMIKSIEEAKPDAMETADLLTIFSIYLGLSRQLYPNFTKHLAENVDPLAHGSDAGLLEKLRVYDFKTESGTGIFKRTDVQKQEAKDIIYIHNCILYCLLMEAQGEFGKGE